MAKSEKIRLALIVQGQVQGVGFRPFVWRLANSENLTGEVRNTSAGVRIEIQGAPANVAAFEKRLLAELPPLAKIVSLQKSPLTVAPEESEFRIAKSRGHSGQNVLVSPDVGVCAECLADMRDPGNPRHGYAFTNCVNCGPRYTITTAIPYDRPRTTMACFELCPACRAEYENPADRRFHAQPIACPVCGPTLWLTEEKTPSASTLPTESSRANALGRAARLLADGKIIALKGLGGFQLVCDARNAKAVSLLRQRKSRPHKALAVMAANTASAAKFCEISTQAREILESPQKPITLLPKLADAPLPLARQIAPDTSFIGAMLPNTPLHALLFDQLAGLGMPNAVLVMTSANPPGEPICLGNREALQRLGSMADAFLLHNRDILARVDDSVVAPPAAESGAPVFIRRARGYAPRPTALPFAKSLPPVLGAGAELKATFCLTRGDQAFLGQHIGDMKNAAALEFYTHSLAHMQKLLETEPAAIVRDLHPDFVASRFAESLAAEKNIPIHTLQHHAAHAAALAAGHGLLEPVLALCLDGSGLGDDGTIWGGELLLMDLGKAQWRRLGRLAPFPLPGGEAAILEPWRIARALQWQNDAPASAHMAPEKVKIIDEMLARNLNCPPTSSCGRLFDAVAAALGLCHKITYEGQAAIRLENAARQWLAANDGKFPQPGGNFAISKTDGLLVADSAGIFAAALGPEPGRAAAAFHFFLAEILAKMAAMAAKELNIAKVALGGGVMQNTLFLDLLRQALGERGLEPLSPKAIPPGDGGVAYGQAAWGLSLVRANSA